MTPDPLARLEAQARRVAWAVLRPPAASETAERMSLAVLEEASQLAAGGAPAQDCRRLAAAQARVRLALRAFASGGFGLDRARPAGTVAHHGLHAAVTVG